MFKNLSLIILLLCISGCSSFKAGWEKDASKWLLPVNIGAAYFGSVALHEQGHAITADLLGADRIEIDMLPTRDGEGHFHLGLTTVRFPNDVSERDITLFRTMGPASAFAGHVLGRELLKSEKMPRIIQPTIAWFEMFNHIGFYYHVFAGLARQESTDLGKEDVWISWAMLGGALIYDAYDFFFDESLETRFAVLFGEKFYEPGPTKRIKLIAAPTKRGGFLGIGFAW